MLHIKEEYTENPNDNVEDLMDDFAKYLDKQDIAVDYVDYSSKTIYVKTIKDLKDARYELRAEFAELRQLGVHIQSSIGTDGLDKDYIKDTKTQTEKLSIKEDFEPYTYVKSKTVYDSDGWTTEYTMYYDEVNDRYVFVFGDSDFYNPNDGYEEFDWECDTEREAEDWFNNYNGFEDDLNESLKEETVKSYWKYNQFEDTLPEGDYYDKYTIKRFRLIPCNTPEDCYEGDIRRFSVWAVTELDYPYKEVYCTKDEAYGYLMDYLNQSRYETIHDL